MIPHYKRFSFMWTINKKQRKENLTQIFLEVRFFNSNNSS